MLISSHWRNAQKDLAYQGAIEIRFQDARFAAEGIRSSDARILIATPKTDPSHHSPFGAEPPRITDDYKGMPGRVEEHETE